MRERERERIVYTGKRQPTAQERKEQGWEPYLPDDDLRMIVELAAFLQRPLLLKGEPGSGKTKLAQAVAHELKLPLFAWYVKSTSRARDGLYTFDAVRRLQDAQMAAKDSAARERVTKLSEYVHFGPLGDAFRSTERAVVLIDEIDKADIDFPNDLLYELDELAFVVEETREPVTANHPPIVIITSNDEKDLPDAFLRRCLFYYIPFPAPERLAQIVRAHSSRPDPDLVENTVARFAQLRADMQKDKGSAGKKITTSELLDWFAVLQDQKDRKALAEQLKAGQLPFGEVLFKSREDLDRYMPRDQSQQNPA